MLLDIADEFVEEVLTASCHLAQHRQGDKVESRDVKLCLEKNWNIRVPGYMSSTDGKKRSQPTSNHKDKVDKVRRQQMQ